MKNTLSPRFVVAALQRSALAFGLLGALTACQLTQAGLGSQIDIKAPEVSILGPLNGSYVKGAVLLTGSAWDDIGVQTVTVTVKAPGMAADESTVSPTKVTRPEKGANYDWSLSIDTAKFAPASSRGVQVEIEVKALEVKDPTAGSKQKESLPVTMKLNFDNAAPSFDLSDPSHDTSLSTGIDWRLARTLHDGVRFSGWADDFGASGLVGVITLKPNEVSSSYSYNVSGTSSWSLDLDVTDLLSKAGLDPALPHLCKGSLAFTDPAGNSKTTAFEYTIDQNADAPFISIPSVGLDTRTSTTPTAATVFAPGESFTMTVTDDNAVDDRVTGLAPGSAGTFVRLLSQKDGTTYHDVPLTLIKTNTTKPNINDSSAAPLALSVDFSFTFPATGLPLGAYSMEIYAWDDVAGKIALGGQAPKATRRSYAGASAPTVIVDNGPPWLQIDLPLQDSQVNSFTVAGKAQDGYDVGSVNVSITRNSTTIAGLPTAANLGTADTAGIYNWSYDPGSPANAAALIVDGAYTVDVYAVDKGGNRSATQTRTLRVDNTKPSVDFASLAPIVGTADVNGKITFVASASDANGLSASGAGFRWAFLPGSAPNPSWADAIWTAITTPPYSATIDTTAASDNTDYKVWIAARDPAGNVNTATYPVRVNQGSDKPIISLSNLDASVRSSGNAKSNLLETSAKIIGAVTDDDAVDRSSIQVQIDAGAWAFASRTAGSGATASFEYDLGALAEGSHYFNIRASDDPTAKYALPAVQSTFPVLPASVYFVLDKSPPTIAVTSDSSGVAKKADFTLAGTATDANGIAKVEVSLDGGAIWADRPIVQANATTATWDWTKSISAVPDGDYTVSFRSTDAVGKTTTMDFAYKLDRTPPSISIGYPAAIGTSYPTGPNFTAMGTASDGGGVGVGGIQYQVDSTTGTWQNASGTINWSANIALDDDAAGPHTGLAEGSHTLHLRSADLSGNTSGISSRDFVVDQTAPLLGASGTTALQYANNAITITGTTSDTNALAAANPLMVSVNGGASSPVTVQADGSWSHTKSVDTTAAHADDGSYAFLFTSTDIVGKTTPITRTFLVDTQRPDLTISSPLPAEVISAPGYTIRGQVTDNGGKGISQFRYSTDSTDGSDGTWTPIASAALNWSVPGVDFTTGSEGARTLWVSASDGLNAPTLQGVTVNYDLNPPTLVEGDAGHPAGLGTSAQVIKPGAYTLAGSANDTNALASLAITATKDGVSKGTVFSTSTAGDWTYTKTPDLGHSDDGLWVYTITATDVANRTTVLTRTVLVDTAAPTTPVIAAFGSLYYDASLPASGTAGDGSGSGLSKVEYSLDGTNYFLLTGTDTWYKTIDLSGDLVLGSKTLHVRATDRAGNVSAVATAVYTVDRADPVVTESAYVGTVYRSADFSLSLDLSDDLGLAATGLATATLTVDGTAKSLGTLSKSDITSAHQVWTVNVPTSYGSGTYILSFVAKDGVGRNSAQISRTVIVDKTPPTFTVSDLSAGALILASNYTASGSATDGIGSGIDRIEYQTSSDGGSAWSGWSSAAGTTGWTIPLTGLTDNLTMVIQIRALDKAGNYSAATSTIPFKVDLALPSLMDTTSGIATSSAVYRNAAVNFSGASIDGNGIASVIVTYSKDGGASQTLLNDTSGAAAWAASLPAPGDHSGDGAYELSFTATDKALRTTTFIRNVVIDTKSPDLTITAPVASEPVSSASYTIRGQVTDNGGKGITLLRWKLGTGAWSPITLSGLNWSVVNADLSVGGEGAKTVTVEASDGLNPTSSVPVSFNYDLSPPSLTETVPDGGLGTSALQIRGGAFTMAGAADDTNALASLVITATKDGVLQGAPVFTQATPGTWTWTMTPNAGTHADDGLWAYTITATDVAGKTTVLTRSVLVDTTPPSAPSIAAFPSEYYDASLSTSGSAADSTVFSANSSGLASVLYSLNGTSGWTTLTGTDNWYGTSDLSGLVTQGAYTYYVRAVDRAGNVSASGTRGYTIDRADPTVSAAAVPSSQNTKVAITLDGTASDANGLLSVAATYTKDGVPKGAAALTGTTGWQISVPITGGDGTYVYTVTATDNVHRAATLTRTVVVDTTAPTAAITSPGSGDISPNAIIQVSGTASDGGGTGVDRVEYSLDNTWPGTLLSGTANWNGTVNLGGEGDKTLYVRSRDLVGTWSATASLNFKLDLSPPTLDEGTVWGGVGAASPRRSGSFNLSGIASDSNGLARASWASYTDTPYVEVTVGGTTTKMPASGGTWSYPYVPSADGDVTFTITATDVVGKPTTMSRTVTVDMTAPSITLNPGLVSGLNTAVGKVNGLVTFRFSADDTGVGLEKVVGGPNDGKYVAYYTVVRDDGHAVSGSGPLAGATAATIASWTAIYSTGSIFNLVWDSTLPIGGSAPGDVDLYVGMRDAVTGAPNASAMRHELLADQESDRPNIAFDNVDSAATQNFQNGFGQNPTMLLTLSDDDAVKATAIEYRIDTDNNGVFAAGTAAATAAVSAGSFVVGATYTIQSVGSTDFIAIGATSSSVGVTFTAIGAGLGSGTATRYWTEAAWYPVSDALTDGSLVQAKIKLVGFPQGAYRVEVRCRDTGDAAKTWADIYGDNSYYSWKASPVIRFAVDYGPPSITVSAPASGTYRADFAVAGSAVDALAVVLVRYTIDGGASYHTLWTDGGAGNVLTANYSGTVDTLGLPTGECTLQIEATDLGNTTATQLVPITIDKTGPTMTVLRPAPSDTLNGASVTVSGEAADNRQLGAVFIWKGLVAAVDPALPAQVLTNYAATAMAAGTRYTIASLGDTNFASFGAPANVVGTSFVATGAGIGTGTVNFVSYNPGGYTQIAAASPSVWSTSVDTTLTYQALADSYRIRTVAVDSIGNVGTPTDLLVSVNQESDRPVISFSNLSESSTSRLALGNLSIIGTAFDDDAIKADSLQVRLDRNGDGDYLDTGEGWGPLMPANKRPTSNSQVVSWVHEITDLTQEGLHHVQLRAYDVNDPARDYATGYNWNMSASVAFYIDNGPPALDITAPVLNQKFKTSSFTVTGSASDTNGIKRIVIWVDDNSDSVQDASEITVIGRSLDDLSGSALTADNTPYSLNHLISGLEGDLHTDKTVRVTAYDSSDAVTVREFTVLVDTKAPTGVISTPVGSAVGADKMVAGTSYIIATVGTTFFTDFGSTANLVGQRFTATQAGTGSGTVFFADTKVNGTIQAFGTASDNSNKVSKVYYDLRLGAQAAPASIAEYTEIPGKTFSWDFNLATTSYPDGDYILRLAVQDGAGNDSSLSPAWVPFAIDQTTDRPVIDVLTIDELKPAVGNLLPISLTVSGSVSDDDGVDATKTQYRYKLVSGGAWSPWTAVTSPGTSTVFSVWSQDFSKLPATGLVAGLTYVVSATGSTDFVAVGATSSAVGTRFTATGAGAGSGTASLADGQYEFQIRSADKYDAGSWTAGAFSWASILSVQFAVDLSLPTGSIVAPIQASYHRTDVAIDGSSGDASGIKRLTVAFDTGSGYGSEVDLSPAAGTFPVSYPWSTSYATSNGDGQVFFRVSITDAFDKVRTYESSFTVDTLAPTVTFRLPTADAHLYGSVKAEGTASDSNPGLAVSGISKIWFKVNKATGPGTWAVGSDLLTNGWTPISTTGTWEKRFKSTDLYAANTADDPAMIYIVAEDAAGNRSDPTQIANQLAFTINQDLNKPVVSITTPGGSILDNTGVITGTVEDYDGVDSSTVQINLGSGWINVATAPGSSVSASGPKVSFSYSLAGLSERALDYTVQVRASDIGQDFPGTADDIPPATSDLKSITIKKDDSPPSIVITNLNNGLLDAVTLQGVYLRDRLVLSGTASDGVRVATVRARLVNVDLDGATPGMQDAFGTVAVADTNADLNAATPFDTWTWTVTGATLVGTTVNLEVEVTDVNGRSTTTAYTLLVDTAVPSVAISSLASNPDTGSGAYNGTLTFRGSASDLVKVERVYYKWGTTAAGAPAGNYAGWNLGVGSVYSWATAPFDSTAVYGLDDGNHIYHLSAVSVDSAGNESDVSDVQITINQASDRPGLGITVPTDTQVLETNAKAQGSATDDDGLATIEIRIAPAATWAYVDGSDAGYGPVGTPSPVSGTSRSIEHVLSALTDGSYKLQIRVRDTGYAAASAAHKTFHQVESAVLSFSLNTAAPTLTLDTITVPDLYGGADRVTSAWQGGIVGGTYLGANGTYVNNDFTLRFSAADLNGIAAVETSLTNLAGSWVSASFVSGSNWDASLAKASFADGTRSVYYRATDANGKLTSGVVTILVDKTPPTVSFTSPSGIDTNPATNAPNVNGQTVTVTGAVSDASVIDSLAIAGGSRWMALPNAAMTNGSATFTVGTLPEWVVAGAPVKFSGAKAPAPFTVGTIYYLRDITPTSFALESGIGAGAINVTARGTVEYLLTWNFAGHISTFSNSSGNNTSWSLTFDSTLYSNSTNAVETGSGTNVWRFPITISAIDHAGNRVVTTGFVDLDPNGDKPIVYITNPAAATPPTSVTGIITLTGTMTDDDGTTGTVDIDVDTNHTPTTFEEHYLAVPVGNGAWSQQINTSANLTGAVNVRVTPKDKNGLAGDYLERAFFVDSSLPQILGYDGANELAAPTPATGSRERGPFTVRALFKDDDLLVSGGGTYPTIQASLDGGTTYFAITSLGGSVTPISDFGGKHRYDVSLQVNSAIYSYTADPSLGNGSLSVILQVTDNTYKPAVVSLTYAADNRPPEGYWDAATELAPPQSGIYSFSGSGLTNSNKVIGSAWDGGSVSGVSFIDVYFVKNGTDLYDPKAGGAPTSPIISTTTDVLYTQLGFGPAAFPLGSGPFSLVRSGVGTLGTVDNGLPIRFGAATVPAGAMQNGMDYVIATRPASNPTDFTLYGAASNAIGTTFTANGPGLGSGTVNLALPGGLDSGKLYYVREPSGNSFYLSPSPTDAPVISATAMIKGLTYTIVGPGDTNYTLYGAANSGVGTTFVATAPGAGTGTVSSRVKITQTGWGIMEYAVTGVPYTTDAYTNSAPSGHYAIRIDKRTELGSNEGNSNGDYDGFYEFLQDQGGYDKWYAYFDTTKLPDGPIAVYYVVNDQNGNKVVGTTGGQIANNPPSITGFSLGGLAIPAMMKAQGIGVTSLVTDATDSGANNSIDGATWRLDVMAKFANGGAGLVGAKDASFVPFYYGGAGGKRAFTGTSSAPSVSSTLSIDTGADGYVDNNWYQMSVEVKDLDGNLVIREFMMLVANNDIVKPTASIDLFGQSNATAAGHVEEAIASPSAARTAAYGAVADKLADLSGTVNIKGSCWDDTGVSSVTLYLSTDGGATYPTTLGTATLGAASGDVIGGYTRTWTFAWNTQTIVGAAKTNLAIKAVAQDAKPNLAATPPTQAFNVVPYVTGIYRTSVSKYASRTRLGKFSLLEAEAGIQVNGYNLGNATVAPTVTLKNAAGTANSTPPAVNSNVATGIQLTMTMPAAGYSGAFQVNVSGVVSSNNLNDNAKTQNIEGSWNDDRYLQVWTGGASFAGSSGAVSPSMAITPVTATTVANRLELVGAWNDQSSAASTYWEQLNLGVKSPPINSNGATAEKGSPKFADLVIDSLGTKRITYLKDWAFTTNVAGLAYWYGGIQSWTSTRLFAGPADVLYFGELQQSQGIEGEGLNATIHTNGYDNMANQFQNGRIATATIGANVYSFVSYYDSWARSLKYSVIHEPTAGGAIVIDLAQSSNQTSDNPTVDGNLNATVNVAAPAYTADVGLWSSIAVDTVGDAGGYPVIMYYDSLSQCLKVARGKSLVPIGSTNWSIANVTLPGSLIGSNVSMRLDASGNLHAVAYDANDGDVVYLSAPNLDGAGGFYVFTQEVMDSTTGVGGYMDLSLVGSTPYVTYQMTPLLNTNNGLKLAYRLGAGNWEYGTVPLASNAVVKNDKTSIEALSRVSTDTIPSWVRMPQAGAPATSGINVALAFTSSDFKVVYLRPEQ